jgi:hypothetical protein
MSDGKQKGRIRKCQCSYATEHRFLREKHPTMNIQLVRGIVLGLIHSPREARKTFAVQPITKRFTHGYIAQQLYQNFSNIEGKDIESNTSNPREAEKHEGANEACGPHHFVCEIRCIKANCDTARNEVSEDTIKKFPNQLLPVLRRICLLRFSVIFAHKTSGIQGISLLAKIELQWGQVKPDTSAVTELF